MCVVVLSIVDASLHLEVYVGASTGVTQEGSRTQDHFLMPCFNFHFNREKGAAFTDFVVFRVEFVISQNIKIRN